MEMGEMRQDEILKRFYELFGFNYYLVVRPSPGDFVVVFRAGGDDIMVRCGIVSDDTDDKWLRLDNGYSFLYALIDKDKYIMKRFD
jgi:hypothetical protein